MSRQCDSVWPGAGPSCSLFLPTNVSRCRLILRQWNRKEPIFARQSSTTALPCLPAIRPKPKSCRPSTSHPAARCWRWNCHRLSYRRKSLRLSCLQKCFRRPAFHRCCHRTAKIRRAFRRLRIRQRRREDNYLRWRQCHREYFRSANRRTVHLFRLNMLAGRQWLRSPCRSPSHRNRCHPAPCRPNQHHR